MKRRSDTRLPRGGTGRAKPRGIVVAPPALGLVGRADRLVAHDRLSEPPQEISSLADLLLPVRRPRCMPGDVAARGEPVTKLDGSERYGYLFRHEIGEGAH